MLLPLRVFDLLLTDGAAPAVTFLAESAASRAVEFLKGVAAAGALRGPDGLAVAPEGIHYREAGRELEVPTLSLKAARAAGLRIDDDAIEKILVAQRESVKETAELEPVEAEPIEAIPVEGLR